MSGGTCGACLNHPYRTRTRTCTRRPRPRFAHTRPNQALDDRKPDTQRVIEERGAAAAAAAAGRMSLRVILRQILVIINR